MKKSNGVIKNWLPPNTIHITARAVHCRLLLYILLYICTVLLAHVSCIMSPVSRLLSYVSCLMYPDSRILSSVSRLWSHVSCLLYHDSCLTSPVFCLKSHVSHPCLKSLVSRLLSHVSCLIFPALCPTMLNCWSQSPSLSSNCFLCSVLYFKYRVFLIVQEVAINLDFHANLVLKSSGNGAN